MRYRVLTTNRFERSMKLCQKRNYPMQKLKDAIRELSENGCLPPEYKPHKLTNYPGGRTWECHIQPDWLLVWEQNDEELILLMLNTGRHSDIF
ncbi:MAG: type II toxin-antitoxin system YafQ family toxin [Bacteroidales bacterium]|nr:type II toxin-antitoxin system YafQ family toxin [Bacteroidales bacterium]